MLRSIYRVIFFVIDFGLLFRATRPILSEDSISKLLPTRKYSYVNKRVRNREMDTARATTSITTDTTTG